MTKHHLLLFLAYAAPLSIVMMVVGEGVLWLLTLACAVLHIVFLAVLMIDRKISTKDGLLYILSIGSIVIILTAGVIFIVLESSF